MKNVICAAIILILAFTSCTKNIKDKSIIDAGINTTNVNLDIKTIDNLSTTRVSKVGALYNRGTAPVYVAGVKIKATYLESITNVVEKTFDYVGMGETGESINMDIPLGSNKFEAVSNATYSALNATYLNNITKSTGTAAKNVYYSAELIKKQPVFAIFKGETTKTISTADNDVDISMTTNNARYSIVLETSDKYDIDVTVSCNGINQKILKANYTKASALIFNNEEIKDVNDVIITLDIFARGKTEKLRTISVKNGDRYYATAAGVNNTLVLTYNSDGELFKQVTGINFIWTAMTEQGSVVEIK
ncbi:MAG: hypothetical protein WBG43_03130 [Marinifilaceae bacterium]